MHVTLICINITLHITMMQHRQYCSIYIIGSWKEFFYFKIYLTSPYLAPSQWQSISFHFQGYFGYIVAVSFICKENHWHVASHWQTLSHNVVSSTTRHEWDLMMIFLFNFWCLVPFSAISWRPVLVLEEAGVPGENHRPWASNW